VVIDAQSSFSIEAAPNYFPSKQEGIIRSNPGRASAIRLYRRRAASLQCESSYRLGPRLRASRWALRLLARRLAPSILRSASSTRLRKFCNSVN
jgi:hypothetical protein